jgi:hypothetical protein
MPKGQLVSLDEYYSYSVGWINVRNATDICLEIMRLEELERGAS